MPLVFPVSYVGLMRAGSEAGPRGVGGQGVPRPTRGWSIDGTEVLPMTSLLFETEAWAKQQFADCKLGDKRRTARLVKLAAQVVSHPSGGLPEQTEKWSDLKAAYRLFDCADVTFEAVAGEHWRQTRQRPAGRYLMLADTTELDFGITRDIPDLALRATVVVGAFICTLL